MVSTGLHYPAKWEIKSVIPESIKKHAQPIIKIPIDAVIVFLIRTFFCFTVRCSFDSGLIVFKIPLLMLMPDAYRQFSQIPLAQKFSLFCF